MKGNDPDIFLYLISNKAFRDWVLKPNAEDDQFWKKWMKEHPESISDLRKAIEFTERIQFEQVQMSAGELDNMLGNIIAHDAKSCDVSANNQRRSQWFRNHWYKIAAALMVFVITGIFTLDVTPDKTQELAGERVAWIVVENKKGERSEVMLPDGTHVDLNHESQLRYPEVFGKVRRVELIGEAYFEVVRIDSIPFIVTTNTIETEVLGTSFNIRNYESDESADISLVTGKIKVSEGDKGFFSTDKHLSPGEQVVYKKRSGQMVVGEFDIEKVTGWKEGVLIFENASLEEFIATLERWYGVDFQIHGSIPDKWRVNGRYQNEKLEDILVGLKFIYELDYKVEGNNVILKLK